MRLLRTTLVLAALAFGFVTPAAASPYIQYGVQDDAWLLGGPGTLDERLEQVKQLGVDVVRINVRWDQVAARRPRKQTNHLDPAYRWDVPDVLLQGLHRWRIMPVVTLVGTPRWANGSRASNFAPKSPSQLASFAVAVATRYPWIHRWLIWNEPNKYWQLKPTSARVYTQTLLNPAYAALKRLNRRNLVGAGVTAPRGGRGSVSPVDWIRGMRAAGARFDAYAHHPYPLTRGETPTRGGCRACENITMANLERLLSHVRRAWGVHKRIWLTEYGYQTNPPDRILGVSEQLQARYLAEAALRAYRAPRVDMLIRFLVRDEQAVTRWQSGLFTFTNRPKLSADAFVLPLAQVSRKGGIAELWGQVRPGTGRQLFRLRYSQGFGWRWLGGTRRTTARGFLLVRIRLPKAAIVQTVSNGATGNSVVLR